MLSSTQPITVDKITASHEGSYLALSGSHGVTVLELPRRYGKHGQFQDGKETIFCRYENFIIYVFANSIVIL